jgi:hypothetical protein
MGPNTDRQTLMVRRSVAAGAGILVLVLFVFLLRGCLNARKEQAFKDYNRDVGALVQESEQESKLLFELLSGNEGSDVDVENQLNAFAGESAKLVDRARETDHPDEMAAAQRYLVETLEFRRDGIRGIADALPNAIARQQERREGTELIADQMQKFLTSDRIYFDRVRPNLQEPLEEEGLDENVPQSTFLPSVDWLQPETVADRVGKLGGGGGGDDDAAAAPGLHGNGIAGATLGGQALSPGTSPSTQVTDDLKLVVQVANQGENTETDVKVNATIGKGGDAIKLTKVLSSIAAGETKSVEMPVAERPPTGQNVPISVDIEPVAGEKKTDNNKGSYTVIFTQ